MTNPQQYERQFQAGLDKAQQDLARFLEEDGNSVFDKAIWNDKPKLTGPGVNEDTTHYGDDTMALLIYYNRIRNDPNEVEYQFGETRDNLDRILTIDTTNNTARTDQPEDVIFRSAAGQIMLRAKRERAWPDSGVIAS